MARKDIIRMSVEEVRRVAVIRQAIDGVISQKKAAEIIGVSPRQVRRQVKRVREEGEVGIIHRSRGRPGNRRTDEKVKAKVIKLYCKKYPDFGPTFASEKLWELDGIRVNRETLRRWLVADERKREWQRKGRKHRQWRQRKEYYGEMVQIDGSHHDWLEGRGPGLVLMGYIDDATGRVFARFYDYEGTMPAMDSFLRYAKKYGLPQSIYVDKHSTYKLTIKQPLMAEEGLSQFERALKELGVKVIHANSPQAKGRIERLFRTFQDRLIKEMRLAGIKSREQANQFLKGYLPKHNKRFGVAPLRQGDLHRKSPGAEELKKTLCIQTRRRLSNDATVRHHNRVYQVEDVPIRRTKTVIVEDRLDGSVHIRNNGSYLRYKEIDPTLIRSSQRSKKGVRGVRKAYIPPKDHPWRQYRIRRDQHIDDYAAVA